jgi:hypothetical protein
MAVNVPCHSFINVNTRPLTHLSGTKPAHCSFPSTVPEAYTLPFLQSALPCAIRGLLCCLYFVTIALCSSNVSTRSREPMPRYYFHFRSGSSIFEDEIGEVFAHDASALQQAKPPITGATGKPRCHRASAAVGLATAPIAIVALTASVASFFHRTTPLLR